MKVGIVGGGMLGLTLGQRLSKRGHGVTIVEAASEIGGLSGPADYGEFVWDRFYHCILPQDTALIDLLREIGLEDELRWQTTGTGYYAGGRFHDMNGNRDFLRFPLLSFFDKFRMGLFVQYARRFANPYKLYTITAKDWLIRFCGRRAYEVFWRPLLKAKFGGLHADVAAVFIWATVTRLFGARTGGANREQLGYVRGGYRAILEAMSRSLAASGAEVMVGARVERIERAGDRCRLRLTARGAEEPTEREFDQVLFTAPTRAAVDLVDEELRPHVESMAAAYPTSQSYLGVACLVLVLDRPLTPYYVLNIGEESISLTGVIEITNLIARDEETAGRSLVYLPLYADSGDAVLQAPDEELYERFRGELGKLFPDLPESAVVAWRVHRARFVQPLPLVRDSAATPSGVPKLESPFQIVNTSQLRCGTLNNSEVVSLVTEFLAANEESLRAPAEPEIISPPPV